ncbi:MAG TPA: hypothetical protein PLN21_13055 [Gemmatales bacterium]|nr:hypothetical protein [Gemmatales bacterium]
MGKLFDSMKQRGGTLPSAVSITSAPRLQVVPESNDLAHVDDHEPMPFYEVPNDKDPARINLTINHNPAPVAPVEIKLKAMPEEEVQRPILVAQPHAKLSFTPAVPRDRSPLDHLADELVVVHQPASSGALEYRAMAEQLIQELTALQAQSMTLLPLQQNSASTLAANLGCAWAEITRHPIVMIDAARTRPGDDLACLFGLTHAPGWEELMTGSSIGEALQQTGRAWLDLIGSGRRLAWANTQAWAYKARHVLQSLSKHYRHIVLLGPAYPHSPLGLVLAETTESTCIVVTNDEAQQPHRETALHALTQQGKPIVGTILLDI